MPERGAPSKYDPSRNEEILDLMSKGGSIVEVAALIGISRVTLYDWIDPKSERYKEDFSNTIKRGTELSESWWHKQGRVNLANKEFSPTLWYMNMKNRFGWADKQENKHEVSGVDEIKVTIVDGSKK